MTTGIVGTDEAVMSSYWEVRIVSLVFLLVLLWLTALLWDLLASVWRWWKARHGL